MFICSNCGNEFVKWQGQCDFCKEWNTLKEFKEPKKGEEKDSGIIKDLTKLEVNNKFISSENRNISKSSELNNLLGGGLVKGGITLLSGEPGIGKSTLALQLGTWIDKKIIYISGEETENQIISRASRLEVKNNNLNILAESNLENIIETLKNNVADLVIIDSVSVIYSDNINGTSGSIGQVRYISEKLVEYGKENETAIILIGHVTKDGTLAGPKTLEHLVDTVLFFEGEKYDNIRILRSLKNRFGATNEIGIFRMGEKGLSDVKNPGLEFISSENDNETSGASLSITLEGNRPIVIESESLTTYTKFGYPKRSCRGISNSKIDLIIAVLSKFSSVKLENYDVYVNIVRGISVNEPGIDLSLVASIISSKNNVPLKRDTIFVGEVSLTGKIKNIFGLEKRIKEADKLGFKNIYIPNVEIKGKYNINIIKVKNVTDLIKKK
ncbi:DNA repair protein RadA [Candidatus Gracilibacteria bacterium]|nr:MAG: DNA repair protein RadA [Candidatus Gracilibacteria bacterium]